MKLLIMMLNYEEKIHDLLQVMLEFELTDTFVLDGIGIENKLAKEVPLFSSLLQARAGIPPYNRIVFSIISNEDILPELIEVLKDVDIDYSKQNTGFYFTIKIGNLFIT